MFHSKTRGFFHQPPQLAGSAAAPPALPELTLFTLNLTGKVSVVSVKKGDYVQNRAFLIVVSVKKGRLLSPRPSTVAGQGGRGIAEAEVYGAVVGDAAVVAGADVGAAGFLAAVGFVALGQKGRMEDGHPCGGARRSETRGSRSGNVGKEEKVDQFPAPVEADGALAASRQGERQVLQSIQALKQRSIGRVVEIARGDNPAPAGSPEGIAELAETVHRRLAPPCR